MTAKFTALAALLALTLGILQPVAGARAAEEEEQTFDQNEILREAGHLFGGTTKALATIIEKVFAEQGQPNAYITGEEISGAIGIGLRYGNGRLKRKGGGSRKVYWQGPSIGFDFGANASKVFTLIYHLGSDAALFQRYPGIEGSFYFVAGLGLNYQQSGEVILAPIRTGVGLRAGASIGYLHYGPTHSWLPF